MRNHQLIFFPGQWIGEGRVAFNTSPEYLRFYTKWVIEKEEAGRISCLQTVEMQGGGEHVFNRFIFSDILPDSFVIELSNELLGSVKGKGILDAQTIAWEFRGQGDFEGFEVYELQDNGDYMFHAEYATAEQFRTIIDGRIWKKSSSA